jgi:hypothetical protein
MPIGISCGKGGADLIDRNVGRGLENNLVWYLCFMPTFWIIAVSGRVDNLPDQATDCKQSECNLD